ncbi:MAG: hypothetical protein KY475_21030, partial [Planctomycetes bacterium]|nr:hypothetical protein [Planctomycetota bacterium]
TQFYLSFPATMDNTQDTIGLTELLDEINRDIDQLRKKHPSDYNIKNITMWWELERERVLVRHGSLAAVKRLRTIKSMRRLMIAFFGGWLTMMAFSAAARLMID